MDIIVQVFLVLVTAVTSYLIARETFGSTLYGTFGALAGILFAPKSGRELRADLKEKENRAFEDANRIYSDSSTKAKVILDDAKSRLDELKKEAERQLSEARLKAKEILTEGGEKTEELDKQAEEI